MMCTEQTINNISLCLSNEYTRAGKINNDVMGRAQRQGAPWQGLGLLEQALLLMWKQACLAPCCPPPVRQMCKTNLEESKTSCACCRGAAMIGKRLQGNASLTLWMA